MPELNNLERRALTLVRSLLPPGTEILTHVELLPGTPDILVESLKLIIFVDGVFWHPKGGKGERMRQAAIRLLQKGEEEKAQFWAEKAQENETRDRAVNRQLREMGYTVVRLKEERINQGARDPMGYVSKCLAMALIHNRKKKKPART